MPRVYLEERQPLMLNRSEYARHNGMWFACLPSGHTINLGNYHVTEHDDGTITVKPKLTSPAGSSVMWRGYLTKGKFT